MIVAVTIRADRYEPLQTAPDWPTAKRVFDDLKPMPPAGFKEVVVGPPGALLPRRRLMIEPALVDRLLTETAEGADALPLLALTLERLYRDFADDGDLTLAEYESIGGMAQVVQTEVDSLLAADPEQRQAQLDTLHSAFIPWLATINPDNDQPMRRLAHWGQLPAASRPLIQAMVEKRLLLKDTRDGKPWSRSRWKACCANGGNWQGGCAMKPRTSRTPTHWSALTPTGTPAARTIHGCWKEPG